METAKEKLKSGDVYSQIIEKLDCRFGAPMGRSGMGTKAAVKGQRIFRRRVPLVYDGAYDSGGAYWGIGAQLFVEYTLDKSYIAFFRN